MAKTIPWKDVHMTVAVWAILILFAGTILLINSEPERIEAKKPEDEIVSYQIEKDKRTGALYDVQVIRCRQCGEVISYVKFDRFKHVVYANYNPAHVCGIKARDYYLNHRYDGLSFTDWRWPTISGMLDYYQRKLRFKN